MKKIISILLLSSMMIYILSPVAAQTANRWDIEVDKPLVYIGDSLTGTVYGMNGTLYKVILTNISSNTEWQVCYGNFNNTDNDTFTIEMVNGWIPPGRYFVNLTIDGFTMASDEVNIIYSEEYLESTWQKWVDKVLARFERAINTLGFNDQIQDGRNDIQDVMIFSVFTLSLICGELMLYFVAYPRLVAYHKQKLRVTDFRKKHRTIKGAINIWHDREDEPVPVHLEPNTMPMVEVLSKLGLCDKQIECVMIDATGKQSTGELVRHDFFGLKRFLKMPKFKMSMPSWMFIIGCFMIFIGIMALYVAWPLFFACIIVAGILIVIPKITKGKVKDEPKD